MTSLQGLSEDYLSTHDDGGGVAGVGVHVAHARDVVVESGVIIHHVLGGRLLGLASETLKREKSIKSNSNVDPRVLSIYIDRKHLDNYVMSRSVLSLLSFQYLCVSKMNLLDTRQIWADTKLPQFQLQNHFWLTENHLQVQSRY